MIPFLLVIYYNVLVFEYVLMASPVDYLAYSPDSSKLVHTFHFKYLYL